MRSPELLEFALSTFTTIFVVVDAPAAVPIFLSITPTESSAQRKITAMRAALAAFVTLSCFAAFGGALFALLGISIGAFRIAGGLLLFLLAVDMLRAQRSRTRTSPEEEAEGVEREDVSIFPMAIPMLAGPGACSTVMVLVSRATRGFEYALVGLAIALTCAIVYAFLRAANAVERRLGSTGMNVIERVMGLILAANAVQFVIEGIATVMPMIRG